MWIENKKDENDVNQPSQTNAPTVGAGGGAAAGVSTTPSTGNFSTTSPIQAQQPTQKWATAQDYLKANQPQATELGQKIETSLTGKLGEQKSAIDTAAQSAQKQIEEGTTSFNPDIAKTAVEKPTEITSSPEKLQDFLNQWNAAYKGPTSFETTESYTPASAAAQKGTEIAGEIKTSGGRNQLLQNEFGVYGAGNQALDTSLLGTAENYGNIEKLAPQFANLKDYLSGKSTDLSTAAQGAQATTQAAQEQTRAALAGNLDKFQKDLASRLGTSQADATAKANGYVADLASGNADKVATDLRTAGIPEDQIKPIIDNLNLLKDYYQTSPDLSQGYNFNPSVALTEQNVATPEDYANAQAWSELTGENGYTTVLNPADATQAGTSPNVNTGFLPDYLKQQTGTLVNQKDQYTLQNTAVKALDLIKDMNNASAGDQVAHYYTDIMKRQGIQPAPGDWKANLPPALKELDNQLWEKRNTPAGQAFYQALSSWASGGY